MAYRQNWLKDWKNAASVVGTSISNRRHAELEEAVGFFVNTVALRTQLEVAAADNVKRVRRPDTDEWNADPGLARIRSFLETKTVWHPIGV